MAVIKHISIKNSNYNAATDYLTTQYDEFTGKPIIDEKGNHIPRQEFILEGIHCDPYSFGSECEETNKRFHKNQTREEIKAHHYIISFDPRDRDDNGLTPAQAQVLGMDFARKNFPGHEALVCTHPDGHNSAGNIHVHIVINSVRAYDVERRDFMERPGDALAGHKHHVTKEYLEYLKSQTMLMCQQKSFYQVDLLNPAKIRITDREYWAQRRGQAKLDAEAKTSPVPIQPPIHFETEKGFLRRVITETMMDSQSMEEFQKKLFEKYSIEVHESRGMISYLLPDRQKPIRGRSLGTDFEQNFIRSFISANRVSIRKVPDETAEKGNTAIHNPLASQTEPKQPVRLITDLETCIKAQKNRAYALKVKVSNLQKMADTLAFLQTNDIGTMEELQELRSSSKAHVKETLAAVKATEARLHVVDKMYQARLSILKNRDVYKQYLNAPNRKKFRESHAAEILLYEAARKELRELTGEKKFPPLKDIKAERSVLYRQKHARYEDYSDARSHDRELENIEANVRSILDLQKEEPLISKTLS
ncbi:relaxase/mobilization nuclease domain-containing protein [Fusibacillus kribbianus]|uniref:Relaxase/mobilization nuclease domain-containing protein n=1 Tax=Fusibacillus kribbianus TaxID=3044208 RepID=A0AAP4EY56_9FIRM|nr:relaxase/mobilization nuclease domain-containing protein [Ruminococcus sp. YH-rum2234]MDI9243189.1 relaxase/mobilization nuclease domain-containing protein [Ruminococcus sp. YH-rum2234]